MNSGASVGSGTGARSGSGAGSATGALAGRRVLLLGGSSEIGLAIVLELQRRAEREVALAGRDTAALAAARERLLAAGCAKVLTLELDALRTDAHERLLLDAREQLGGLDVVVLAVGVLDRQSGLPADIDAALEQLRVNTVGASSLLMRAATQLSRAGGGAVVVLSSVATERPRRANAAYGASKAGLDALARGLGDALHEQGVHVLVARPGFVHTRMTQGLEPAPLSSTPQAVAETIVDGLERGRPIVWAPPALRWLMLAVRMLPDAIFRRIER